MRRLTYALEFVRQAAAPNAPAEPIVASSLQITTAITNDGVTTQLEPLDQYLTATVEVTPTPHHCGTFTEAGTITFGGPDSADKLNFSSVGVGYTGVYKCPEEQFTTGTVAWAIDGGEGFFQGATGAVTSNFLVDKSNPDVEGTLIAYHFGVVYLP